MATTKRKAVAIMEVVSNGSPQKFFTREGECHRVSPLPKKYRELKPSQLGIKKTLVKSSPSIAEHGNFLTNPHNLAVVHGLIKSAVKEALEEHEQKRKEHDIILEDIVRGVTMRSLVSDWSRTSHGKMMLEKMTDAVNDSYAKANDLPYHRRVQHGDVLTEIKHLTKEAEGKGEVAATTFLEKARSAIEGPSGLPGNEFLALVSAYVQTNQQVHVSWTEQKLKHVLELAGHNEFQVQNMRIGAMMRSVLPALAQAIVLHTCHSKNEPLKDELLKASSGIMEAYNFMPNLDILVPALLQDGIQTALSNVAVSPGIPVKPMLAKIANGTAEVFKRFQGKPFTCEYKYDGQRAQVHLLKDGTIKIFSRNCEDTTSRFPDVIGIVRMAVRPGIQDLIFDAEIVAVDRGNNNKLMPFQHLSTRERGRSGAAVSFGAPSKWHDS